MSARMADFSVEGRSVLFPSSMPECLSVPLELGVATSRWLLLFTHASVILGTHRSPLGMDDRSFGGCSMLVFISAMRRARRAQRRWAVQASPWENGRPSRILSASAALTPDESRAGSSSHTHHALLAAMFSLSCFHILSTSLRVSAKACRHVVTHVLK